MLRCESVRDDAITGFLQYAHRQSDIGSEVSHHKVDHVVDKRVSLDNALDHMGHLLQHRGHPVPLGSDLRLDERRRAIDALDELGSRGLGVVCGHDRTDNRYAVETLLRGFGLVENALDIGQVDASDGDRLDGVVSDGVQEGLCASGAEDVFRIGLAGTN